MASTIILFPKPNTKDEFFNAIIPYVQSQGFTVLSSTPLIFFTGDTVQTPKIKALLSTIQNTDGYSQSVNTLYYSIRLDKA